MLQSDGGVAWFRLISTLGEIGFRLVELETFPGGWVAGSSETKANLAQLGLRLGLSLAILIVSGRIRDEYTKNILMQVAKSIRNWWII